MKKFGLILSLLVAGILAIHDVYEFFGPNRGMEYYSQNFRRILLPLGIALAGALTWLAFFKFSPHQQHKIKLVVMGGIALVMTLVALYFATQTLSLFSRDVSSNQRWHVFLIPFIIGAFAIKAWFEFYRIVRDSKQFSIPNNSSSLPNRWSQTE